MQYEMLAMWDRVNSSKTNFQVILSNNSYLFLLKGIRKKTPCGYYISLDSIMISLWLCRLF